VKNSKRDDSPSLPSMYLVRVAICKSPRKVMGANVRYGAPDEDVSRAVWASTSRSSTSRRASPAGASKQKTNEQNINRREMSSLEQRIKSGKDGDLPAECPSHHSQIVIGKKSTTAKIHQNNPTSRSNERCIDLGGIESCATSTISEARQPCLQKCTPTMTEPPNAALEMADSSSCEPTETIPADNKQQTKVVITTLKFPRYISNLTTESIIKDAVIHQLISQLRKSLSVSIEISSNSAIIIKSKGLISGAVKVKEATQTMKAAIVGTVTNPGERYLLRERWREHARHGIFSEQIKVPRSSIVRPDLLVESLIGSGSFDFYEMLEKNNCWAVIDDECDHAIVHGNSESEVKSAAYLLITEMYTAYKVLCEDRREREVTGKNVVVPQPNILPTYSHEEYVTFPVWLNESIVQRAVANADVRETIRSLNEGDNYIQIDYLSSKRRFSVKSKSETDSNNTCSQLKNSITYTLPSLVHRRLLIESWGLGRCMKFHREIQLPSGMDNCATFVDRFIDSSSFDCFRLDQYMDKMHCHVFVDDPCTVLTITGDKELHVIEASEFLNKRLDYLLTALGFGASRLKPLESADNLSNPRDHSNEGSKDDRNALMKDAPPENVCKSSSVKESCSVNAAGMDNIEHDKPLVNTGGGRFATKEYKFPSWIASKTLINEFVKSDDAESMMKQCNKKDGCNIRLSGKEPIPYFMIETNSDDIARDASKELIQSLTKLGVGRAFQRVLQETWIETAYLYAQQIDVHTDANISKEFLTHLFIDSDGFSLDQFMDSYACSVTISDCCEVISVKGNNQEKVKVACNTLRNRLFLLKTSLQRTMAESNTAKSNRSNAPGSNGFPGGKKPISNPVHAEKKQHVDVISLRSCQSEQIKSVPDKCIETKRNQADAVSTDNTSCDDPSAFTINIPCWVGDGRHYRTYLASPSFQDVVHRFRAKRLEIYMSHEARPNVRVKGSSEQLLREAEINLRQVIIMMVEFQPLKALFRESWSRREFAFEDTRNIPRLEPTARMNIIRDFAVQLENYKTTHPTRGSVMSVRIDENCQTLKVCSNVSKIMKVGLKDLHNKLTEIIRGFSNENFSMSLVKDNDNNSLHQKQAKDKGSLKGNAGGEDKNKSNGSDIALKQSESGTNRKGRWGPSITSFEIDISKYSSKSSSNEQVPVSSIKTQVKKPIKNRGRSQSRARSEADNQQSYSMTKQQKAENYPKEGCKAIMLDNADKKRCRSQSRARFVDDASQDSKCGKKSKPTNNLSEQKLLNKLSIKAQSAIRKRGRSQSRARFDVYVQEDQCANGAKRDRGRSQSMARFDIPMDKYRVDEDRRSRGRSQSRARFDVPSVQGRVDEEKCRGGRSHSISRRARSQSRARGRSQSRPRQPNNASKKPANTNKK